MLSPARVAMVYMSASYRRTSTSQADADPASMAAQISVSVLAEVGAGDGLSVLDGDTITSNPNISDDGPKAIHRLNVRSFELS